MESFYLLGSLSFLSGDEGLDPSTETVTDDDNVLHLQMLHGVLQSGAHRWISTLQFRT